MRQELAERPLAVAFLALAIGLSCAYSWWHLVALGLLASLVPDRRSLLTLAVAGLAGMLLRPAYPPEQITTRPFTGQVVLIEMPRQYENASLAAVRAEDGRTYSAILPPNLKAGIGDRLSFVAVAKPWPEGGVRRWGEVGRLEPVGQIGHRPSINPLWRAGASLHTSFEQHLAKRGDPTAAPVMNALIFGDGAELDDGFRSSLQRAGLAHLVAASGLHVLVLGLIVFWGVRQLPIGPGWQATILVSVLLIYAGAAGLKPPIVRAVLMAAIYAGSTLVERDPDALSAIAGAGVITLLIWPHTIGHLGFHLSYAAVVGLALFLPRSKPEPGIWARAKDLVRVNVIATLSTAPIVMFAFGELPLFGWLAGLVIIPLMPILMSAAILGWATGMVALLRLAEGLTGTLMAVTDWLGSQPWAAVAIPWISPYWVAVIYAAMLLLWQPKRRQLDP